MFKSRQADIQKIQPVQSADRINSDSGLYHLDVFFRVEAGKVYSSRNLYGCKITRKFIPVETSWVYRCRNKFLHL